MSKIFDGISSVISTKSSGISVSLSVPNLAAAQESS
jgi:hypothetical protein